MERDKEAMTDPMTPVRALIEAAGKATPGPWTVNDNWIDEESERCAYIESKGDSICTIFIHFESKDRCLADSAFIAAARAATASISQLLSEHDKVVGLQAEMRARAVADTQINHAVTRVSSVLDEYADRLQSIVEGK